MFASRVPLVVVVARVVQKPGVRVPAVSDRLLWVTISKPVLSRIKGKIRKVSGNKNGEYVKHHKVVQVTKITTIFSSPLAFDMPDILRASRHQHGIVPAVQHQI